MCLTRTEACERLKVGYWRFRGLSTRPRVIRHSMPRGPHRHRIAYVPIDLARFLALTLTYGEGAVPKEAIEESEQRGDIAEEIFVVWATERNLRRLASLYREVGLRAKVSRLLDAANRLRECRERMVKIIIGLVEERMPDYRR